MPPLLPVLGMSFNLHISGRVNRWPSRTEEALSTRSHLGAGYWYVQSPGPNATRTGTATHVARLPLYERPYSYP